MIKKTTIAAVALLAFVAKAETCEPTNVVVAPLTDAHWTQGAPYNEYSPLNDKGANWAAGCVAIAAAQELLVWQWPWRFGAVHEASHIVAGSDNATIRFDGTVPFEWDALKGSYSSSDSLASRHAAARLALFCQSLVQMQFVSSGGEAKKGIDGTMEWYEYDDNVVPSSGDAAIERILSDLEFGSPLQVGVNVGGYGGHEVVGVGYGIGTNAIGETVRLLGLNMGWGGSVQWWNLASTSGSYIKSAKVGFRPIKSVQIEPVAPVSGNSVTLNWHLPNCYTNKISGFTVAKMRLSDSATTWTDDFSNSSGRTSNSKAMRVKDGALYAWDGTSSAIYTYDEKFMLTSNSKITYDIGSAYMSGMDARIEAKFEDGEWQTVHRFTINGGKGDGQYYNWGTMVTGLTANIGGYAGKIAQFRIAVEYTKGGVYYSSDANMKIDNLSLSDVLPYGEDGEPLEVSPSLRSATFSGLEPDVKYAFSVAPVMIDGSKAIMQRATTTIGSPTAMPEGIQISAVVNGIEMLQEGFYLECGSGTTTFTVTSANATELKALPSHLSILPDNAVSVSGNAGVFTVTIDGSKLSSRWEGAKTILTLKASNGDGAVAAKDIVLKFNRNVVMGARTYALVSDTNATAAVEFTGGTTIDGDGHTLTVKAGALTGLGDVTLSNGTFIFEDIDSFAGTIKIGSGANVTLPGAASSFAGVVAVESGTVSLSSGLPATATLQIGQDAKVNINGASILAKLKGSGSVYTSETSAIGDCSEYNGTVYINSGTTTISAGNECSIWVYQGTLNIALTAEQTAFGYATTKITKYAYLGGAVKFVKANNEIVSATESDGSFVFGATANTWSSDKDSSNSEWDMYSEKWSDGLPGTGDNVMFKSLVNATVACDMDLDTDINAATVKATGSGGLFFMQESDISKTGVFTADTLINDVKVELKTSRFRVNKVMPSADIIIDYGAEIDCEVDSASSAYIKKPKNGVYVSALDDPDVWHGTVVFKGSLTWLNPNSYGNTNSVVRLNGTTGYLAHSNPIFSVPVELIDDGEMPALDWNDGAGASTATFYKLMGDGTFKTSTKTGGEKIIVKNIDSFTGAFDLSQKTVAIGTAVTTNLVSGVIDINNGYSATVYSGKKWNVGGGVFLDGPTAKLDVKGTLDTAKITALADNAQLVLSDGGLIEVDSVPSDSKRISANLYAGTFRIDGDATVSDGFCFSSTNDTYTTIDVNGHNLTFAAGAISGHGAIYPTSSAERAKGAVVFEDFGSWEGRLVVDGTTAIGLPPSLGNATIALQGAELSVPTSAGGSFAANGGAVLTLTLDADQASSGYTATNVTLDDSSTLAFADESGNVLAVFTPADDTYAYVTSDQASPESLEETGAVVTIESQLAFKDATLAMLTSEALGGKFGGDWAGTADGADVVFNNFDRTSEAAGTITCQAQVANDGYVKGVLLTFTQSGDGVYVLMTGAKYIKGASLGDSIAGGSDARQNGEWTYAVGALSLKYLGPPPTAVWVAGEFGDDRSAHGGLEFALNGNTTNALGQIVIGTTTALGAEIGIPAGHSIASVLVKYSIPDGAHVDNSVLVSMFSAYDLGALSDSGESTVKGYWFTGSAVSDGSYAFSSPAPGIPQDGYLLLSYKHNSSTAAYIGAMTSALAGGANGTLHFSNNDVTKMAFGGPTVVGAKPWAGMVIKSVAIFLDEYLSDADLATYRFPGQGAVLPEDSDLYAIEPVAKWVNDFKTTEKNGYTLSVSGTTAAKDDSFGGTLTIGNASAVIDTTAVATSNMTVLIKYRAASNVTNAPVVAFGAPATYGLDVGVYTKLDKTLAVYRNFSTDNGKPYNFSADPVLSATGGYVLCARDNGRQCMAYVGDSLDAMTGGAVSDDNIKFSNLPLKSLGIGGNSSFPANANDMVPFTGFEIEKIVIFSGYYTPDQIRYVPIPEDSATLSIADGATWNFAAGTTRTYTNIGTISTSGTIAITNASELTEGTYPLATWTTPQQYTAQCAGYGKVGTLVADGLASGLSARLVYGARAIYLRVDDTAKQTARKPLVVWCYGDSITEGYNAQATGANYRILLYQKLEMLGYNVRSTGVYGLSNNHDSVDPTGTPLTDQYKWHSAKHGATAGPTTLAHRSNLSENVDTLAIQAGTPDVALLLIGVNDIPEWKNEADRVTPVLKAWTNVVNRMVKNLPDTKIVVSTILYSDGTRTDIDPTITAINTQIKNLFDNLPAEWQGHVVLADLNSIVKSGDPGIIYSDHLHPDWWGYDQMADGYLEKIVECYPNPDATDFPSQNPIPDAPTTDQLGAANKPELATYRAGFTKLCNIRVEKGQDVNNVVYDDMNSAAATNNLEKVGYFVEFVRDDNHAHKWVWVDMDAFGDADLASVGLPQRIYQQAVTKMHVCSNHGAIDNVAADDDSVTGWIEFSPYNYDRAGSNSSAPANYGDPFDWNDTLSTSGSYGCMQVFRVMNPSSRDLYERPQLMFAFNNFQSANSNPVDFGIGNFAQHFNCNNSYHTEDWTGVGGTLAKMAPDAYSVKTIEIWTKLSTPVFVRDNIVKRADGTVYHGNDENRAIITNWEYQINRPLAPPAPNTIDILYVLDKPSREYIENTKNMSLDEFFAKSTAFMNQMLCPTDMDTNFWFRMVGVYPLDVQAQEVSPMLGRSKNSSEPGFELVNEMRNRVGADIVFSVSRNGGGIGGLAYVNSYENIMSGAAAPLGHACGFLEYSQMIAWVHEIAHVMSCNHTPPDNIDVNNPRHRQFGVVVRDDNATEEPFYYRTIMTGWYYGGQTYCFSSKNHYYNGVQLSVSNHVDATQVMVELAPYVAQWRPTKVPERPEITFFPQDQAEIPAGVETMVTINYSDPDAEIYWYDATSGEDKSDARLYTGPISVVGGSWKMLYAFAKTNGVEVAESEKTATYFLTGMYGRFDYSQVLDSDGITWSMPLGDSSEFAWDKDTSVFCAGESSYQAHVDMESLTNSRPSTCYATAMLTLTEAKNLNFRHLDSYTNAMFSVWVDDVPVYYKKGASDTGGEWRKEVIRVESGTHRIEFVFTQTAEDMVDAQTSEGDEHALVDDEKYQRYIASLVAAETSRVWIDGFEWTPTDMIWAGDEATGDGVWATDVSCTPWEGGVPFADDAVVTFPDLAAGSPTVAVKGVVRPSKVNFTGANTAYTFVPQDDNAFVYISNGSFTEFKTNAAIRVPFRLDAAYIRSAAKCTLELGNVFGHGLTGPGSEGSFWGQIGVGSKSTVIMNPGAGRVQTVGDFGKNWSYTDSDLVFTNGTVKVNGVINGGNGLFQYKRIHVKNGAVLELVTTDATGYDVAANNTIEVERGAELRIDDGDRLRRPMKLSGGKLTVSRSGSVHALALYNNPSFTVTADSVLTNGNAAATLGFVGQDATITLQNNATLDCYVPFANGIMDGDSKNVTISGNGTFVQNTLMIQFTNKVTVANGVTFRQNAVTSGMVGKSSWDVNGTLEANAIMQVSALTLASGATLSVKVTDANVSNAAILCDATPSLSGSIVVNAASDLANGKYAVISATGLEDGIIARVSAPTLAKRATFAVEEGGLFMTVADYTEGAFTDTSYPVPYSWMMEYYPSLRGNPSEYTELQALQPAASAAHSVWECYVLGLDPTNETSKFLATIRMNGAMPIVEYSPTNTTLGNITYVLQGKPALSNDWQNVEFDEPGATNRFFRVKVTW